MSRVIMLGSRSATAAPGRRPARRHRRAAGAASTHRSHRRRRPPPPRPAIDSSTSRSNSSSSASLAGLRLVGPPELELLFRQLDVGRGVLERVGGAVVLDRVLSARAASGRSVARGQPAARGIRALGGLARPPVFGAFAVTGHGTLRSAQRVSRCGVWHLHQRQYLRSCSRSGLFRLLLFVW